MNLTSTSPFHPFFQPLSSQIPDMISDSENYVKLLKACRDRSQRDLELFSGLLGEVCGDIGVIAPDESLTKRFCANASGVRVQTGDSSRTLNDAWNENAPADHSPMLILTRVTNVYKPNCFSLCFFPFSNPVFRSFSTAPFPFSAKIHVFRAIVRQSQNWKLTNRNSPRWPSRLRAPSTPNRPYRKIGSPKWCEPAASSCIPSPVT